MLNHHLEKLVDYPFRRLTQLLAGIEPRAGLSPVSMSVGEPRNTPPSFLAEVIARNAAGWGRYPPVSGTPDFRAACAEWLTRRYRLASGFIDPDRHVLPCAGTREALFMAAQITVPDRPGTAPAAVLMPNPFYQVYHGAAAMTGAEPVLVAATRASGFLPDLDAVAPEALGRAALMYLCTPANPQGAVADLDDLKRAITLSRRHDFVLAVDECYAEIYCGRPPPGALEAAAALGGGLHGLLVFHSLSKRSSVPGLRSGFVAGDAVLIEALARLRDYSAAATPLPVLAASAALWRDEDHVEASRAQYRAKFDAAERLLAGRFGFYRPAGGFYLWLDVGDGEDAARRLWRDAAVRTLPGAFLARAGANGVNPGAAYIRVALVDDLPTTVEALQRIAAVLDAAPAARREAALHE